MYIARLVCSDPQCAAEVLAEAPTLAELDTLACDCGCGVALIAWPDHTGEPLAEVAVMPLARSAAPLVRAA